MKRFAVIIVILLAGCSYTPANSSNTSPTYKTDIVTFTYTKEDFSPWPWTVASMTVTCTDMGGGATAVVNGRTYGITGREATHSTIRGYDDLGQIMLDPAHDEHPSTSAFDTRVEADCTQGMKGH
jgi:hypothetical protein